MLGFQAKAGTFVINPAIRAAKGAIQEVAGIKLNPRLSGVDFQHPARGRLVNSGGQYQLSGQIIQHKVMIVAAGELELLVVRIDSRADGLFILHPHH